MKTKKKISLFITGLILICLIVYGGIYLYASSRPLVECPCDVKVQLPLQTDMITGWQVFLGGEIADFNTEQIVLLSKNKTETATVKLTPGGRWKTMYEDALKISEGENPSLIELKDLKIGDKIFVRAALSEDGNEYYAVWVSKVSVIQ